MKQRAFARAEMIAACVILVALLTLAFVTFVALRGEREQQHAQQQAQMMDRLRRSLWRMDSQLTSIIAREAARPPEQYVPFYPADRTQVPDLDEQFVSARVLASNERSTGAQRLATDSLAPDDAGLRGSTGQFVSKDRADNKSKQFEAETAAQASDGTVQSKNLYDKSSADAGELLAAGSFNDPSSLQPAVLVPSELLTQPDSFTNLHFQSNEAGELASPQVPRGRQRELSRLQFTTPYAIETAERKLDELALLLANAPSYSLLTPPDVSAGDAIANATGQLSGSILPGSEATTLGEPTSSETRDPSVSKSVSSSQMASPLDAKSAGERVAEGDKASLQGSLQSQAKAETQPRSQTTSQTTSQTSAQTAPQASASLPSPTPGTGSSASAHQASPPPMNQAGSQVGRQAGNQASPSNTEVAAPAPGQPVAASQPLPPASKGQPAADADYIARQELARNASSKQESQNRAPPRSAKRNSSSNMGDLILQEQYGQAPVPTVKTEPLLRQEGFRPEWIVVPGRSPELIFTRVVDGPWGIVRQGFWLDWQRLENQLLESVRDTAPGATLRPVLQSVTQDQMPNDVVGRMLATVPAELVMPQPFTLEGLGQGGSWTPLRTALVATWLLVLAAMLTLAWLARAADKLAENRGRFVTAVTHELRTPLTSFCMYSQMLADDMVPDEQVRREYARTLHGQSLRLSRIVESVLDYARLGRARRPLEVTTVGAVRERIEPGLVAICERSGCTLDVQPPPAGWERAALRTDIDTIDRVLTNLIDNACKYGLTDEGQSRLPQADADQHCGDTALSKPKVSLAWEVQSQTLIVRVRDFGKGIPPSDRERIFQAFERGSVHAGGATPGLGLGLALSHALAEEVGGQLKLVDLASSEPGAAFELRLGLYS